MRGRALVLSHMGALAALAAMAAPAGAEIINATRPTSKRDPEVYDYPVETRAERRAARSNKKHKLKGLRP